ncbi:MAG: GldG family protein [Betaproteobacteria bacterium]|nr:GldG family protein [Betaproteobacteria bacterium]
MELTRKLRLRLLVQHGLSLVLLVVLVMLLAYLAHEYRKEWDVTRAGRNTLSASTLEVLGQLDGPLTITAYAVTQDATGANVHKRIEERLRVYQRAKPDIALTLVDPREQPKQAEAAGVRTPNELVVEYRKRTEHLAVEEFNEQTFANLLMRLARGTDSMVLWLDGHGERKLNGAANHDLGDFGRQLQHKGLRLNSLNLAVAQEVPANAAALIIASPQVELLPAEVEKVQRHIEGGGNLLWLIDPEPLRGLQPIAEILGLVLTPGTVVDLALQPRSGPPVFAVGAAANYGRHAITNGFRLNTLFPHARQIGAAENDEWHATPLVDVAQRGWVEAGKLDRNVTFDKARDIPGPVPVAQAFERSVGDRQQRVVVVGSGQFLSNAFIGNGGNLDFGINIINWLTGADHMIAIEPRAAADSSIEIDQVTLYLIAFTFLMGLPLAFVITGTAVWWRRRKAV